MSYAMTHLLVAMRFAEDTDVGDRDMFMLGSVAPDTVHCRTDFSKKLKARSHCLQEEETWGEVYKETPIAKWYGCLRGFWNEKSSLTDNERSKAFLMGYTVHILTDLFNCSRFYAPNMIEFGTDRIDEYRNVYRSECIKQDNWLRYNVPQSAELLEAAARAAQAPEMYDMLSRLGLDGYFTAENLRGNVSNLLDMYREAAPVSLDGLTIVTGEGTLRYIEEVAAECERLLFDFPEAGRTFRVSAI